MWGMGKRKVSRHSLGCLEQNRSLPLLLLRAFKVSRQENRIPSYFNPRHPLPRSSPTLANFRLKRLPPDLLHRSGYRPRTENSRSNIISPKVLPPLFISLPHDLCFWQIKLPSPEEPQQGLIIKSIISNFTRFLLSVLWCGGA